MVLRLKDIRPAVNRCINVLRNIQIILRDELKVRYIATEIGELIDQLTEINNFAYRLKDSFDEDAPLSEIANAIFYGDKASPHRINSATNNNNDDDIDIDPELPY